MIGESFAATTLATVAETDPLECAQQLEKLDAAGFLLTAGSGYDFRHPLMREVADGLQLESQRAQSHARLAATLEASNALAASGSAASARIAHHWQQAGEWAKAGQCNLVAARWAGTRDTRLTIQQFLLALANLDRAAPDRQVQHLRIAARAGLIRIAQFTPVPFADVERAYAEGRAMASESGDIAGAAELMISYGNELLHRRDAEGSVRLHRDAVRYCMEHGQAALVQRFRLAILLSHFSAGRPREGIALVDTADDGQWRHEAIGEDNFVSRGFHSLMLIWLGELPKAQQQLQAVLDYASREGRNASWMHAFMVDIAWFTGDYSEALHHGRQAMERAQENGGPYFHAIAGRALGLALCLAEQFTEAITLLESLTPLSAPDSLAAQFESNHLATLARAYLGASRFADAHRAAEAAIASAQHSNSKVWEIYAWLFLLRLPAGEVPRARVDEGCARLEQLIEDSGAEGFRPWLLLAKSQSSLTPADSQIWRQQAIEGFICIGAPGNAARLLNRA